MLEVWWWGSKGWYYCISEANSSSWHGKCTTILVSRRRRKSRWLWGCELGIRVRETKRMMARVNWNFQFTMYGQCAKANGNGVLVVVVVKCILTASMETACYYYYYRKPVQLLICRFIIVSEQKDNEFARNTFQNLNDYFYILKNGLYMCVCT